MTTLPFGPAVGGEPVAADGSERQPQVVGIRLQGHINAERRLAGGRMRAAHRLHRLDLQRVVSDGVDALPNRARHRIAGEGAPWERFEP
ncbi:hypothetical protein [Streptomyces herbicida]|uniref:hypothetical protein n=1 Tax=Streptomyces herbicida TaxID=3065675 RepID=UPI00292E035D|nr:hypothetical protein [Streptomyces sp. NEAU-HV9]